MHYMRCPLADLPFNVGETQPDGSRSSDGRQGYLSYGPYVALPPGNYFGGFHVRRLGAPVPDGMLSLDAVIGGSPDALQTTHVPMDELLPDVAGLVGIAFSVAEPCASLELRLHVTEGLAVNVTELKLFRV